MRRLSALWMFVLISAVLAAACAEAAPEAAVETAGDDLTSLEGVWSRVATVVSSDTAAVTSNQPGLRLYVDGHYSIIRVEGLAARPPVPDSTGTVQELMAVWGPTFTARSGTYDVDGTTVTERQIVSKNPGDLTGQFNTTVIRIVGDTMWNTLTANQNGPIADPQTGRYVRVRGGADPLRGAWLMEERRSVQGGTVISNQPGVRLNVDGYYSLMRVNGTEPRTARVDSLATAADLRAAWGTGFTANAGPYEVSGQTLTDRVMIAKNPDVMAPGAYNTVEYRLVGDTMWITNTATQAGPVPPANQATSKYVRAGPRPVAAN